MVIQEQELMMEDEMDAPEETDSEWKPTPIEVTHPESVDPGKILLFKEPAWALRMTIEEDRSYLRIKVARAAPLSDPDRYICFLDAKDEVICMVTELDELPEKSRPFAMEELDWRYLTARIEKVISLRNEYGVSYWEVETDRGLREFVARSVGENAQWLNDTRLIIFDVDGNRFEIADIQALDKKSTGLMELVL